MFVNCPFVCSLSPWWVNIFYWFGNARDRTLWCGCRTGLSEVHRSRTWVHSITRCNISARSFSGGAWESLWNSTIIPYFCCWYKITCWNILFMFVSVGVSTCAQIPHAYKHILTNKHAHLLSFPLCFDLQSILKITYNKRNIHCRVSDWC